MTNASENGLAHPDIRVERAEDVHTRALEDELVVLDLSAGEYFGLNETARRLFDGLCEGRTPREIALELAREFAAEEEKILADLVRLTGELMRRGLVVARKP